MISSMSSGLPEEVITALRLTFAKHKGVNSAILYGSRALGTFRANSDIDITLMGDLNLTDLLMIATEIDDLMFPYKVDLSLKSQIDNPQLIEHIDRVGVPFYQRSSPK